MIPTASTDPSSAFKTSVPFVTPQPSAATETLHEASETFVDRRRENRSTSGGERRQFGSSHFDLSEPGRELAMAIDQYKVDNHRRYLTCDELLGVITSIGYIRH